MKNNQHGQLFTELTAESEAPAFEELDNENAATIQGGQIPPPHGVPGGAIAFYDHYGGKGLLGSSYGSNGNEKPEQLPARMNDKASSVHIHIGTWALWTGPKLNGKVLALTPGLHNLPRSFNNQVSSVVRIGF
jgi:hypothetical protein